MSSEVQERPPRQHVSTGHGLARVVTHPRTAAAAVLLVAAVAVCIGLAVPHPLPLQFIEEGGVIETVTIFAYLVAVLGILLLRSPQMSRRDVLAVSVVLLAMGAREADLHTAMYGISILKSRFYLNAQPHQVLGALSVLAPVAASAAWLLYRYARCWLQPWSQWSTSTVTTAMLFAVVVIAKMLDRAPDVLGLVGHGSASLLHVMLALEEVFELSLPLFVLLAVAQSAFSARAQVSAERH